MVTARRGDGPDPSWPDPPLDRHRHRQGHRPAPSTQPGGRVRQPRARRPGPARPDQPPPHLPALRGRVGAYRVRVLRGERRPRLRGGRGVSDRELLRVLASPGGGVGGGPDRGRDRRVRNRRPSRRLGAWTGIATVGLVVGSFALFGGSSRLHVPWWEVALVVLAVLAFFVGAVPAFVRARFSTPTVGREGLIGELAQAEVPVDPDGVVVIRGSRWRARTNRATPILAGASAPGRSRWRAWCSRSSPRRAPPATTGTGPGPGPSGGRPRTRADPDDRVRFSSFLARRPGVTSAASAPRSGLTRGGTVARPIVDEVWQRRAACRAPGSALFYPPAAPETRPQRDRTGAPGQGDLRPLPGSRTVPGLRARDPRAARDLGRAHRERTPGAPRTPGRLSPGRPDVEAGPVTGRGRWPGPGPGRRPGGG